MHCNTIVKGLVSLNSQRGISGIAYKIYLSGNGNVKPLHRLNSSVNTGHTVRGYGSGVIAQETRDKLIGRTYYEDAKSTDKKITVVGTGDSTMAAIFALLTKGVTKDVCMIDFDENKLFGEQQDLLYGAEILGNPNIVASTDYAASAGSSICVYSAGSEQAQGETESEYIQRNVALVRNTIPQLVKYSPDAVFVIASEPNEILAYQAWKAGGLQRSKVMGTGTNLDSAKFQHLLANKTGLSASRCGGRATGMCGKPILLWSAVTVAGVCLRDLNSKTGSSNDPENWREIYKQMMRSNLEVRSLKGKDYTWCTGLSIADICKALLSDSCAVRPVAIYAKGEYSIRDDVFVALPCVLGSKGVTDIVRQPLSISEEMQLKDCVRSIVRTQECMRILQ